MFIEKCLDNTAEYKIKVTRALSVTTWRFSINYSANCKFSTHDILQVKKEHPLLCQGL